MDDSSDKQTLVSLFLKIACFQPAHAAMLFLRATFLKLKEAIQLYFVRNEARISLPPSVHDDDADADEDDKDDDDEGNISIPPSEDEDYDYDYDYDYAYDESPTLHQGPHSVVPDDGGWGTESSPAGENTTLPVIRDVLHESPTLHHGPNSVVPDDWGTGTSSAVENATLPVIRDVLHESPTIHQGPHPVVPDGGDWGPGTSSAGENTTQDNLASLYRPPLALMFHGRFEQAKDYAKVQNKWLLVNMQSTREFNSHMLNRDTWANETVFQAIKMSFIFWQINDDTEEGMKVCTYYKIQDFPAVLLVDPITGQKMQFWRGMVQPETLLEDLLPFMDGSPSNHLAGLINKRRKEISHLNSSHPQDNNNNEEDEELQQALAISMENNGIIGVETTNKTEDAADLEVKVQRRNYLPLPEEPKGDTNMLCRVGIRLPDGRRSQRNFLRSDPVELLWSFCFSELKEDGDKIFHLNYAMPGASKSLDFDDKSQLFEDSDLANSLITVRLP